MAPPRTKASAALSAKAPPTRASVATSMVGLDTSPDPIFRTFKPDPKNTRATKKKKIESSQFADDEFDLNNLPSTDKKPLSSKSRTARSTVTSPVVSTKRNTAGDAKKSLEEVQRQLFS